MDQVKQLSVVGVIVPGNDGNPVVQMVPERVSQVVHNHQVLDPPVAEDPQVLHVDPFDHQAVPSVQPVVDQAPLRIQIVQNAVRVSFLRGGEHNDFKVLISLLQDLPGVRPNVEPNRDDLPAAKVNIDDHFRISSIVIDAVDESLIQVKDYRLFQLVARFLRQIKSLRLQLGQVHWRQVADELDSLEGLVQVLIVAIFTFGFDLFAVPLSELVVEPRPSFVVLGQVNSFVVVSAAELSGFALVYLVFRPGFVLGVKRLLQVGR